MTSPYIVVGLPRSGTSFVASVLHEHMGICMGIRFIDSMVNDNRCFEDVEIVRACENFSNNRMVLQEFHWRMIARFNGIQKHSRTGMWGFKEPRLAYGLLGFVISLVPDFTLIHCVRKSEQVHESMGRTFGWKQDRVKRICTSGRKHLDIWLQYLPYISIDCSAKLTPADVMDKLSKRKAA